MRLLDRNKHIFYYALRNGRGMETDARGNYTGEPNLTYSDPVKVHAYVSATRGSFVISSGVTIDQFGLDVDYDKIIHLEGTDWDIDEDSILWVDDTNIYHPYDYIIKRIAIYLGHTVLAIKKVRYHNEKNDIPVLGTNPGLLLANEQGSVISA